MEILKRLFGGPSKAGRAEDPHALIYYVKGNKCSAITRVRIDTYNDLSLDDDGESYIVRKMVVDNVCYGTVEIELNFDANRNEISRHATGGTFVTREEYEAYQAKQAAQAQ
ncbi:MAG: hypothetical protein RMN25_10505 [Anaerolineae bacterium]|nr:hypothetical protein [Thermoflexales bacterium]MDW8408197.1 hypothetical protein [Anaerolineae bacterium]